MGLARPQVPRLVRDWLPVAVVVCALALSNVFFGYVYVTGGSMGPSLRPGDLVVYRRTSHVAERDVALFEKQGWRQPVLHRVVGVSDDGDLRVKGDANPVEDRQTVTREDVRGKAVATVPSGTVIASMVRLGRWCYTRASMQ